jgi:hypothetical protein
MPGDSSADSSAAQTDRPRARNRIRISAQIFFTKQPPIIKGRVFFPHYTIKKQGLHHRILEMSDFRGTFLLFSAFSDRNCIYMDRSGVIE